MIDLEVDIVSVAAAVGPFEVSVAVGKVIMREMQKDQWQ